MQSSDQNNATAIEKENIQSLSRLEVNNARNGTQFKCLNFTFHSIKPFVHIKTCLQSVLQICLLMKLEKEKLQTDLGKEF